MSFATNRARLIKLVRIYPLIAILVLLIAYLLGGFSDQEDPIVPRAYVINGLYLFAGLVPLAVIIAFIAIGAAGDRQFKSNQLQAGKLSAPDPFILPSEQMRGYKLALITGKPAVFTGLTGDTYLPDASANCAVNPTHTPPVAECECGFYAYQDLAEAKFELSINPGAFVIEVDLYGLGIAYQRGWRAESQVVRRVFLPKRCMNCRILPAKVFTTSFKLGFNQDTWWAWQVRCLICSRSYQDADKLSIMQMGKQLQSVITT
jgi:hypothetical protein